MAGQHVGGRAEGLGGGQRGGHEQGLRDGGVADLVGVGRGAVGDQIEPDDLRPGAESVGQTGQLKPGCQEARCLGTLARGDEYKHKIHLAL